MFSRKDLEQFKHKGVKAKKVMQQLENFEKGFPKIKLVQPAIIGNGIKYIVEEELIEYQNIFDSQIGKLSLLKFVPASGAATRMFKRLYDFLNTYQDSEEDYLKFLSKKGPETMFLFFEKLKDFPFYDDLNEAIIGSGLDIERLLKKNQLKQILTMLLSRKGLDYGNLPKGLLKFHRYKKSSRTAFEEHLVEALRYCKNVKGTARLHLTISEEHKKLFTKKLKQTRKLYEEKLSGTLKVSFSAQKNSTDTIAVDMNNKPFRIEDGSILFRPGGHGALIENLNDLKADIIFIKNIDNVVPDRLKDKTIIYKKVLAGVLLEYKIMIFEYLKLLDKSSLISDDKLQEILKFTEKELCVKPPENIYYKSGEELHTYLYTILNRPIRVCGMVKNEGEPGGGPFWVKNTNGTVSLQIVEISQIDMEDNEQQDIMKQSTHFNPVDIVCSIKDFKEAKFNLTKFVNDETGFISTKSYNGNVLKSMELPGLWNGSMSDWNTIFVEVPMVTFSPVKTVFDLLRIEHRN